MTHSTFVRFVGHKGYFVVFWPTSPPSRFTVLDAFAQRPGIESTENWSHGEEVCKFILDPQFARDRQALEGLIDDIIATFFSDSSWDVQYRGYLEETRKRFLDNIQDTLTID